MATGIGQLQTSNLFSLNAMRVQTNKLSTSLAQLASGSRLVNAAIDPSGLAISNGFRAQLGGIDQAVYNAQDAISVTRTADSALDTQGDILNRMRDLSVRASNDATLNDSDRARLNTEFQSLSAELNRQGRSTSFNTKQLTTDAPGQTYGTQAAQVGPNNGTNNQIAVTIDASTADTLGGGAGNKISDLDISTTAGAQNAIDVVSQAIDQVSSQRAALGVKEKTLDYAINDLSAQRINMSAANSRIADTNMAEAFTSATTSKLLQQVSMATLSQNKAQAWGILKLIGSV